MPRSDWRLQLAIIGVLSFGFGALLSSLIYAQHQQEQFVASDSNSERAQARPQQSDTPRAGVPSAVQRFISNPEPDDGTEREKRDLAAQEASAAWAFWVVLFGGLGFIVTTIGTAFLYQQIKLTREAVADTGEATEAMQESNRIARDSMRQDRAWIKIEKVRVRSIELKQAENRPSEPHYFQVGVDIDIRNVGRSPAIYVQSVPMVWLNSSVEVGFEEWRTGWMSALEVARARAMLQKNYGRIIFPNDPDTFSHTFSTLTSNVPGTLPVDPADGHDARLFVTAIVLYQFTHSDLHFSLSNTVMDLGLISNWVGAAPKSGAQISARLVNGSALAT